MKAFVRTVQVVAGRAWNMKARAVLVAAGLGLAAAAGALVADATAAPAPSVDPDAAEFTIMGQRFRIPEVYLSGLQKVIERTPEYKGDSVHMRAVMPDLTPITKRDTKYDKGGEALREVVRFEILAAPGYAGPNKAFFRDEYLRKCLGRRDGYLVCPHPTSVLDIYEVLVRVEGKRRLAFDCTKEGARPSPHCRITLPLLDDIELYISFSRKHFHDADRLLARIYDLVCSFLVAGPARELTVNHCD